MQFIVAVNIKICCPTVQAVRCARRHFILSPVITLTEKQTLKDPREKQENMKITRKTVYVPVLTTVSMKEFIPFTTN